MGIGDGRALCSLERAGEDVPVLVVGNGRWYISGEAGAATRTEDTETRGYRSWSEERSMLASAAVNGGGCAGGDESVTRVQQGRQSG